MKNNKQRVRTPPASRREPWPKSLIILFGGKSAEHEVSIQSAASVISALNTKKYDIIPIAISKSGEWLSVGESIKLLPGFAAVTSFAKADKKGSVDVVFPVLHGPYGEDGTMQGMLEILGVPYVGAGVMASAVGMDKGVSKILFESAGLNIVPWLSFLASKWKKKKDELVGDIEKRLPYPVFIKPIDLGSSVGITKAHDRKELLKGIRLALSYGGEVIVEGGVDAREIECSVLGNEDPVASVPGEIIASREFYSYEAKYTDEKSELVIPAKLTKAVTVKIQASAIIAFKAIKCSGMARVDFLIDKKTGKIYINEVNTIPGFTKISMYTKLWQASGVGYSALLDKLIKLATERHKLRSSKSGNSEDTVLLSDIYKKKLPGLTTRF